MSWFKGKRKDEDSTIQVTAQVIADADQAAEPEPVPLPLPTPPEIELSDDFRIEPALVSIAPELYDQAVDERRSLVTLCLYAHDRARSSGVAERIEAGLAAVGVVAVRPDGAKFDPALHEAGGTATTADDSLDGTVAETEVVGFSDRGQVLRPPIVTVYTKAGA
ncbi:Heat shock protein GrpE [Alloactinosynnema sp. L-07]|uniref:nucleotide exchange factor GrpE n=1 Tax=Alloactinosynnema sp. L-07 TaxID=1653480 RepID=UPI00065F08D2|nr:nucleotide exchange factor GrpE [Alloactinosynnema sp. L-07]CRK60615.1 Heat shock protein GrpE [Alloactinosynnema sp. L-07]